MRTIRRLLVFLGASLLLASCQVTTPDPATYQAAHSAFDELRRGDFATLNRQLAPNLKMADAPAKLTQLRQIIPMEPIRSRRAVGSRLLLHPGGEDAVDITEEYDFGDRKLLWNTHLHRGSVADPWEVQGFQATNSTVKELAANNFTLRGKTPAQYLFLMATVLSPVLMIMALARVIRTKGLRRKWLWGIAAFLGLFSFQMNWATGQIFATWGTVQLLGAGATRGDSAFAAWVLTMTIPIGALLILTGVWANPARARKRADAPIEGG